MLDLKTINFLFGRKLNHPPFLDVKEVKEDAFFDESLTRGLGISGNPGSGKTTSAARLTLDYSLKHKKRPVIVFDASGALISRYLQIMMALPPRQKEQIMSRLVVDMPGCDWVIPKPLFHDDYGLSREVLVQKVVSVLEELNREKMERNPTMATAIQVTAPEKKKKKKKKTI